MPLFDLQTAGEMIPAVRELRLLLREQPEGVAFSAILDEKHANADGAITAHGGVTAALLDTAATLAVVARTQQRWATVSITVNYPRATRLGAVSGSAAVIHQGRAQAFVRTELRDERNLVCAEASVILARIDAPRP